jgi:hypothetical protein
MIFESIRYPVKSVKLIIVNIVSLDGYDIKYRSVSKHN